LLAGHVRQKPRGTGLYYPVTEHRRADGSRDQKWHSPGFKSEKEAKKQLARLRVDLERGDWIERSQLTVADFLEKRWLPAVVGTVRATTYSGYEGHVRRYIKPRLGGMRLQDLSPEALSAFYATLKIEGGLEGAPLASATVQRVHATLHRSLRDAARWGLVIRNVAALAIKPREGPPVSRCVPPRGLYGDAARRTRWSPVGGH
jgi:integrase